MGKRKIALFFDEDTEDGKQILEFLTPFSKRKSDIVGELILLWISEHGTNVPVQWLDRKSRRMGVVPQLIDHGGEASRNIFADVTIQAHALETDDGMNASGMRTEHAVSRMEEIVETQADEAENGMGKMAERVENVHDASLIKAGLASFLQG